jgi:predicted hotdog family 3-hydroxylacyl-ACP dehydratase
MKLPSSDTPFAGALAADFLPHAAPFVLLDRVIAVEGLSGRFTKCVAADDPLVGSGGVLSPLLVVEAMAQGAGVVLSRLEPELRARGSAVLAAVDRCELAASPRAGDVLTIEIEVVRRYNDMARVRGRALIGDQPCASATLTLAFAPNVEPAGSAS